MLGGRLPETDNKSICHISCLQSSRGGFRNLSSGRLRESFWNSIWMRNKKLVTKWSLSGGDRLATKSGRCETCERVDPYMKHQAYLKRVSLGLNECSNAC